MADQEALNVYLYGTKGAPHRVPTAPQSRGRIEEKVEEKDRCPLLPTRVVTPL